LQKLDLNLKRFTVPTTYQKNEQLGIPDAELVGAKVDQVHAQVSISERRKTSKQTFFSGKCQKQL
jgi:hypothetical protein